MKNPAPVTCLMIAYNTERYIEEAIASLIGQTRPPAEIVLIDDGSTDDTAILAQRAGGSLVRVIRQENAGIAVARNRSLKEISQPFVMFADADDVSEPDRIERSLAAFDANPQLAGVFGNWVNFWIDELAEEQHLESSKTLKGEQTSRYLCTAMFRADLMRRFGDFDPTITNCEVYWLHDAFKSEALFHDLGHQTYRRRLHHTNVSRKRTKEDLFQLVNRMRAKTT